MSTQQKSAHMLGSGHVSFVAFLTQAAHIGLHSGTGSFFRVDWLSE